jgi:6-phosphogluconate dehydrogenase (decarboxylating)
MLTKLENFNMKINLIGLGKLGYPMSLFLSSAGYKINCFDISFTFLKRQIVYLIKFIIYCYNLTGIFLFNKNFFTSKIE